VDRSARFRISARIAVAR